MGVHERAYAGNHVDGREVVVVPTLFPCSGKLARVAVQPKCR